MKANKIIIIISVIIILAIIFRSEPIPLDDIYNMSVEERIYSEQMILGR